MNQNILYRAIIKVACNSCDFAINNKTKFDVNCKDCKFIKYRKVREKDLKPLIKYLNIHYPSWTYMNLYEYVKGKNGRYIKSYQKGKNEP